MRISKAQLTLLTAIDARSKALIEERQNLPKEWRNLEIIEDSGLSHCNELKLAETAGPCLSHSSIFGRFPTRSESASFSRAIRGLEEKGLVALTIVGGRDSPGERPNHVRVTDAGHQYLAAIARGATIELPAQAPHEIQQCAASDKNEISRQWSNHHE